MFNTDNIEVFEPDLTKGKLVPDKRFVIHHDAVEEIPEVGHYNTIMEYPNGGKDVEWVVDTPGVKAQDAWDEYEDILRFVPFTELELATNRIAELKQKLQDTDYHILKVVEGALTLDDCTEIMAERASWRKEINELEIKMNSI
jgi:hypothetical protein